MISEMCRWQVRCDMPSRRAITLSSTPSASIRTIVCRSPSEMVRARSGPTVVGNGSAPSHDRSKAAVMKSTTFGSRTTSAAPFCAAPSAPRTAISPVRPSNTSIRISPSPSVRTCAPSAVTRSTYAAVGRS